MAGNIREGRTLLSIVNAVGEALYLSDEPFQVLNSVLDRLIEGLAIDCAWIHMLQDGALTLICHRGFTPEIVSVMAAPQGAGSLTGRVAASGQPVLITDIDSAKQYAIPAALKAGLRSLLTVPIRSRSAPPGVVGVASRSHAFDAEMVELLGVLGNHMSIALEKADLFSRIRTNEKRVAESEAKFRTVFQESGDAILLVDAARGVILDANREAERLLGAPAGEIIGMHHSLLHPADKVEYYRAMFRHHTVSSPTADVEGEISRRDGTTVPVIIGSRLVPLQDGSMVQIALRNMSEVKRAERRTMVKDSAIASSMSAITLTDLRGNLTYVNNAFLRQLGYAREAEVLGRNATTFLKPGKGVNDMTQALRASGSWAGELSVIRKDGTSLDTLVHLSIVRDSGGEGICLTGTFTDITLQKQNEAKIREQSQRLHAIGELARVISSDSNIGEIFETFARQLKSLLAFDRLSISVIEGDRVKSFAVSSSVESGSAGEAVPVESSATGWVAANRKTLIEADLTTSRFRAGGDLRSSIHVPLFSQGKVFGSLNLSSMQPGAYGGREQEILEQLAAQIAGAIQSASLYSQERAHSIELEKQKEEWIRFTGIAAHELKTPLTSIIAGAELLGEQLKGKAPETEQRLILNIVHSARSLETSLDELLELTRMKTMTAIQLSRQNIRELIEGVLEYVRPVARRKEQSLAVYMPDFLPILNIDSQRIGQVLRNLLVNATKLTPHHGKIALRVRQQDNSIVVEVQDTGAGMSKETQGSIFDENRGEADREQFPGMGLGLALSKQIVTMHGGRIWVESEPGRGSTFGFSLPI